MKFICFLLVIAMTKIAVCQNTLVRFEVKNQDKIINCDLLINDTISLFKVDPEIKKEGVFIKNKIQQMVFYKERILNQEVYVKDSIYLMKWELMNDTATILNQACLSAKTNFRGRNYIAYYSQRYKTDDGPWKFGGLPGLILSLRSEDNYIEWKAIKIVDNYSDKIEPVDISDYKFMEWSEFVFKYKQTMEQFIKATRSSGRISNEMSARLKIDATEIFYPELQTGEGIKF